MPTRMRRCGTATIVLVAVLLLALPGLAHGAPGELDPSFDGDGRRILADMGLDHAEAVVVQPDGRILVAGSPDRAPFNFAIARLNPDGGLDTGFDDDGVAFVDFGGLDYANAVALQPDGRILVAGRTRPDATNPTDVAVARLLPNGGLDTSFEPGGPEGPGKAVIDYTGHDVATDVLVQPDGKIVIVGAGGPASALAVTRLQPDGSSDNSFDGDGIAGVDLGGGEWAEAVALQADGRIVAAGGTSRNSDVAVVRFKAAGPADMTLDGDFGAGGVRVFGYGGTDLARDVLIQADGKIVVAGKGAANEALVATRLDASGLPDPSFDGDGNSLVDFGKEEEGEAALLQPNGKIVLVGNTSAGDDIAIARLQPGGTLDTTFASDGKVAINFGGADYGKAAALQADGKMVIAGSTDGGATVARIEADPPAGTEDGPGGGGPVSGPGAPLCAGRSATVVGTMGRDLLRGTRRADVIVALAGNDRVSGAGGADLVCGGRGNDSLRLGRGPDRIHGERGKDMLSGGPGKDLLKGGPGNDRLAGGSHLDRCLGGPGRDRARTCEN